MSISYRYNWEERSHSGTANLLVTNRDYAFTPTLISSNYTYVSSVLFTGKVSWGSTASSTTTTVEFITNDEKTTLRTENITRGTTHSFQINYPLDEKTIKIRFKSIGAYKTTASGSISYHYVPYSIYGEVKQGRGFVSFGLGLGTSETGIRINCRPESGYKLDYYNIINKSTGEVIVTGTKIEDDFDPKQTGGQYVINAYFSKITYTVNYHTLFNDVDTIIYSKECQGDTYYSCENFPELNFEIPIGYSVNPQGWTLNTSGFVRNDKIYETSSNLTKEIEQYNSFTNLTKQHEDIVDLYYTIFPNIYMITLICYKKNDLNNFLTYGIYYKSYEDEINLRNLPTSSSITSGYKLANMVDPITNLVDSSRTNNWFTSNEHMKPGDETITSISAKSISSDIELYSYETPIQYVINYHTKDIEHNIVSTEKVIYDYGATYEYLPLPEIDNTPIGYARNPLGWIDGSYSSADVDFNSNFMYRYNKSASDGNKINQYYGEFSNLTNSDMAEINLYVGIYPYRYKTVYETHQYRDGEWVVISSEDTSPRYYNVDYSLVSARYQGYISLSLLEELGGSEVKPSNTWFISEEHMEPGDEVISSYIYANTLADNITLYNKIIPIKYTVNYYIIDENGEETLYYTQTCDYGTIYEYLPLPEFDNIPIGYARNPLGWMRQGYNVTRGAVLYNSDWIYDKYYADSYLSSISQYYGSFCNLSEYDNSSVAYYCCIMPIIYSIYYYQYKQGSLSQYSTATEYRVYGMEKGTLRTLPSVTTGYKLTNKMEITNGPAILTDDYWFTSNEHMNPEDEKIKQIPSTYTDDIYLYSYETPINYSVTFHTIDENGNELNTENLICYYNQSYTRPNLTSEKDFYELKGWYEELYDTANWHINGNTLEFINGIAPSCDFGSSIASQFTTQDQGEYHYYAYYIPYGSVIKYLWLDNYGKDSEKFKIPDKIKKYGEGNYEIETIPSYPDQYSVENEGTKQWYYYENNDTSTEQLINTKTYIEENDFNTYIFYGRKSPLKRHITFSSQNEDFGTITVLNPTEDELYDEGYEIQVQANPTEIAYFSNWSDGNNSPNRTIIVGSSNMHYMGIFRSNQVYVGMLGILESYKNISKIKSIIPPNKIAVGKNSYTIENPYTYGFYLNNNGYYESNNKKVSSSFAMCKVNITAGKACKMYVDCINYAESSWDYGMLSKINTTLSAHYDADSSSYLQKNFSGLQSSYVQTVTYDIPAGNSYIYIKYKKDGSVDSNNDSLQFKIRFE